MMRMQKQQTNLFGLKSIIILVGMVLAGCVGYLFYTHYKASTQETISTQVEDVKSAPVIDKPKDLDSAATAIDQLEVESTNMDDMSEIDNEMSAF